MTETSNHSTHRRSLLKAAALATAAVGTVGAAVRLSHGEDDDLPPGALELSADDGSDVASLEVPLDLERTHGEVRQTAALPTSTYSMVAVTWRGDAAPEVLARAKRADGWSDWTHLPVIDDLPAEDAGRVTRNGTAAWWTGPSRSVQVRVRGAVPGDPRLVLLHPATRTTDLAIGTAARTTTSVDGPKAPRPDIATRSDWGADESWRDGRPRINTTIEQVHVHHTASGNDYSRSDTAALIRGFYRYHTHNLGWSDIGYNFLVDRFGRTWEGRAGGIAKPVKGAHTLGFNDTSMGVSCIGNFQEHAPPQAVVNAVAALAAWKLDLYDRQPRGRTRVRSTGSDKYRAGAVATLKVIDGHRDTNDTACPGTLLYQRLPEIRTRAHRVIMNARRPKPVGVVEPATVGGAPTLGRGLKALKGRYDPTGASSSYQWLRDGQPLAGETTWRYRCTEADLGEELSVQVTTTAPEREALVEVVPAGRVTAPVSLDVVSHRKRGQVRARIDLKVPKGLRAKPGGRVTVSVGKRTTVVDVTDLDRAVTLGRRKPLAKKATKLVVSYPGDRRFAPATVTQKVG